MTTRNLPFTLTQRLIMRIPLRCIRQAALSFDHAGLNGQPGIDLVTRRRGYPPTCLHPPAEHLARLRQSGRIGDGLIVTQTYRNCPQNPRCPLYTREHGICQTAEERVTDSQRPYYGIAHGEERGFHGLALDFRRAVPDTVRWWAGGIPVLWNGAVLSPEAMASEVADHSHLWRLCAAGPHATPQDVERYQRLAALFCQHLHAPAESAGAALWREALRMGLERQDDYLHNAVGVGPENLVLVVAHGSLERLGELARSAGATHAVVVDNGGSCQIAVRQPGADTPLLPLIQGPNFRAPTITLAAYELDGTSAPSR